MAKKNKAVQEYSSAILQVFERLQTKPLPVVACTMKQDCVVDWTSRKKDIYYKIQWQKWISTIEKSLDALAVLVLYQLRTRWIEKLIRLKRRNWLQGLVENWLQEKDIYYEIYSQKWMSTVKTSFGILAMLVS